MELIKTMLVLKATEKERREDEEKNETENDVKVELQRFVSHNHLQDDRCLSCFTLGMQQLKC